mmetsp:Transcript_29571/g.57167  ORF Transcript_29571/g.57167 Transcript_29571/m.57167 type:complete len:96 (+) Transcript_29571:79-366(+)
MHADWVDGAAMARLGLVDICDAAAAAAFLVIYAFSEKLFMYVSLLLLSTVCFARCHSHRTLLQPPLSVRRAQFPLLEISGACIAYFGSNRPVGYG